MSNKTWLATKKKRSGQTGAAFTVELTDEQKDQYEAPGSHLKGKYTFTRLVALKAATVPAGAEKKKDSPEKPGKE